MSSHRELPSSGLTESPLHQQERLDSRALRRESSIASATEHTYASRSSNYMARSDSTALSSPGLDEAMEKNGS
jgi:hypothetical protein